MRRRTAAIAMVLLVATLLALPFVPSSEAAAHPLGNFTINRYARIEVYRDRLRLYYVLDYAEIPAFQLKSAIDANGDGALAADELDRYAASVQAGFPEHFSLTANGERLEPQNVTHSAHALPGQGGLDTIRFAFVYDAAVSATGNVQVGFTDHNFEDRAGWKEIVVRPSSGAVADVPGSLLTEQSAALTSYPAEDLKSAPNMKTASFTWTAGTGSDAEGATLEAPKAATRAKGRFDSLLDHDGSFLTFGLLLLAAAVFGAQHALGPGHGKTVVAAYLVGNRGTVRHAVALGLTVTATHTSSVYVLGFITLAAAEFISPERLYLYLGLVSGLSIVAMGLLLFRARLRKARHAPGDGMHRHGLFGKAHSHLPAALGDEHEHEHDGHGHHDRDGHDHDHSHRHGVGHDHGLPGSDPALATGTATYLQADPITATVATHERPPWRDVFSLGVIGGLLPCPSAIVVMLAAISQGRVLFGMLLIVAFSLGLAAVLTTIGVAVVLGKRLSNRNPELAGFFARPALARAASVMPVLSAAIITVVGLVITYGAIQNPGL